MPLSERARFYSSTTFLVFPTRHHRYIKPGPGISLTSEESRPADPRWAQAKPRTSIRRLPTPCLQFAQSQTNIGERRRSVTQVARSTVQRPDLGHVSPAAAPPPRAR